METIKTTPFGKEIKKRLVDLEQKQAWLIDQVAERTGLYFDGSYLHKVMTGQLKSPKIVQAIKDILEIPEAEEAC